MAVSAALALSIEDSSQVATARRAAAELARRLTLDDDTAGRLALVVTEAAANVLRHGRGGRILLRITEHAAAGVEVLALDQGPGMDNVARCAADGYSSGGTPGTGLGAIQRQADFFDAYSRPNRGTALLMRVAPRRAVTAPRDVLVAGVSIAKPGEEVCGDAWDEEPRRDGTTLLVADGLGHGPAAAEAAAVAVQTFRGGRNKRPGERLDLIHAALRATRGAAVAVLDIDLPERVVRFAGLGNISAFIDDGGAVRHLVSHNGTAGHVARRIEEYTYPWPAGGVLVMHSDGLATVKDLAGYAGLLARHPGVVAGVLYRDFVRGRDDATVVVAAGRRP
jgi:anti-sigma regulatory factor (Ser/Thr protein kinase)